MTELLTTTVGSARVLHRLALAVECRDALSDRPADALLTARMRRRPTATNPQPVWWPLDRRGTAQFTFSYPWRLTAALPDLQLVVDDPTRRYVPRRFTVTPWQLAEVAEPAPYVEARARLLRIWLLPASAYALPRTATVIRGRVTQGGQPARWARVQGTTPTSDAGWAHADERGEFLLPILDAGHDLTRDTREQVTVTLRVIGRTSLANPVPPTADRTFDLVSEVVPRSPSPVTPADLDNAALRGTAVPPGYLENAAPARQVIVLVGAETTLTTDVLFVPQP